MDDLPANTVAEIRRIDRCNHSPRTVLDLPPNWTEKQLTKAFRRLCALFHPDTHVSKGEDVKKQLATYYQWINQSYEKLSSPAKPQQPPCPDLERRSFQSASSSSGSSRTMRSRRPRKGRRSTAASRIFQTNAGTDNTCVPQTTIRKPVKLSSGSVANFLGWAEEDYGSKSIGAIVEQKED